MTYIEELRAYLWVETFLESFEKCPFDVKESVRLANKAVKAFDNKVGENW